jgi:hypothetical protein
MKARLFAQSDIARWWRYRLVFLPQGRDSAYSVPMQPQRSAACMRDTAVTQAHTTFVGAALTLSRALTVTRSSCAMPSPLSQVFAPMLSSPYPRTCPFLIDCVLFAKNRAPHGTVRHTNFRTVRSQSVTDDSTHIGLAVQRA